MLLQTLGTRNNYCCHNFEWPNSILLKLLWALISRSEQGLAQRWLHHNFGFWGGWLLISLSCTFMILYEDKLCVLFQCHNLNFFHLFIWLWGVSTDLIFWQGQNAYICRFGWQQGVVLQEHGYHKLRWLIGLSPCNSWFITRNASNQTRASRLGHLCSNHWASRIKARHFPGNSKVFVSCI
jgi:hypothetical protein